MSKIDFTELSKAREQIRGLSDRLHKRFSKTNGLRQRANSALWLDLGSVYEEAAKIESDELLQEALIEEVNSLPDVVILPSWDARDKSIFECLLVLAAGYEDKESLRSRWLSSLRNALEAGVPRTEKAFAGWVKELHGIVNAANGDHKGTITADEPPAQVIANFALNLDFVPDGTLLDFEPPFPSESGGFVVALLKRLPEGGSRVMGTLTDERTVASTIKALLPKKAKPLKASRVAKIERDALRYLNRFVLKELKIQKGRPKATDLTLFLKSTKALSEIPELKDRYFDGDVGYSAQADTLNQRFGLEVKNPDFHVLDPGRFIDGAKKGALVPYEFDDTKPFDLTLYRAEFPGLRDYLENLPRRIRKRSGGSTAGDVLKLAEQGAEQVKSVEERVAEAVEA